MGDVSDESEKSELLHATTIALAGKGALIWGPSGSGKSGLALQLLAFGAILVADDRTRVTRQGNRLIASAPSPRTAGIEARFVGILGAPHAFSVPLTVVVDMEHEETERLPIPRHVNILGLTVPLIRKSSASHFPAALALYLKGGRRD